MHEPIRRLARSAALGLLVALAAPLGVARGSVAIDAKDVELPEVLRLLAAQGVPTLTADAAVAKQTVTFAVRDVTAAAAVRWLCRACGLVVVAGQGNRLVIGKPSLDKAVLEEYNVVSLVPTPAAGESLLSFVKRVVLGGYQQRERAEGAEGAEPEPRLEATLEKGRLKVLAPKICHREVQTLLRTMAQAKKPGSAEELSVAYKPYELGLLSTRTAAAQPPPPKGDVTFDLAGATAYETAWTLTSKSKASFFIDPWDEGLRTSKVTLSANKMAAKAAAEQVAKQLSAEQCWYDGAWLFVRAGRRPLFDGFAAKVYNVGAAGAAGSLIAEEAERRAKDLKLPEGLPYSADRVGDRLLAAMPEGLHRPLETLLKWAASGPKWPMR